MVNIDADADADADADGRAKVGGHSLWPWPSLLNSSEFHALLHTYGMVIWRL
jgi:hypothetical protein